jgi:hypothetical protein
MFCFAVSVFRVPIRALTQLQSKTLPSKQPTFRAAFPPRLRLPQSKRLAVLNLTLIPLAHYPAKVDGE